MAHVELSMNPPDLEPGSWGTYRITDACTISDFHFFHMLLWTVNHDPGHIAFQVSAVMWNPQRHTPAATGTYRIMEKDYVNRVCIVDVGHNIGRRMNMTWRLDVLASARQFTWHAWP